LSGNEAIAKGAIDAGVSFFASYPITPATEIMQTLVKTPVEFVQAEDEIAAISMCIGASLAGAKTLTATSGPGFSLYQESIGLAFKLETPLVIVDAQRVGPSTGMPTMGAQGDILQAKHGSHGDYTLIVFYPNSVEECYKLTIEAINASEESQAPVILLTDGFISGMYETANLEKIKCNLKQRKNLPINKSKKHFTGLTSEEGIPRTNSTEAYIKWYNKRKETILKTAEKYNFYEYTENKNSDTLLIAYGISSRVISPLKEKYSIFRPIRMFPVVEDLKNISKKYSKIVVIEMNDGQYYGELEGFLKRDLKLIKQLGGKISLKEIENELSRIN
jgi:2-oxoglutarate ferredoxin oxidoreductase subunit alpha